MKALSVRQPWVWLIANAGKDVRLVSLRKVQVRYPAAIGKVEIEVEVQR